MRMRVFLLAVATLVTCVAAAPLSDPKAKALDWLTRVGDAAAEEMAAAQADLAKAKTAVQTAQQAAALSHEQHDANLEARANAALATARDEAARAQERITKSQARIAKIKSVMANIVPGATGVALEMSGGVTIRSNGASRVWNGSPAALKPGDLISTSQGGRLVLVFDDGRTLKLGENTSFQFQPKPGVPADAPLLQRAAGYLREGVMQLSTKYLVPKQTRFTGGAVLGQIDYRTPTAVIAVRGTEFQLKAIANQPTRFVPMSGEVEIKADADGLKGYAPSRWWPDAADAAATPARGAAAVLAVVGATCIEGADGKGQAAAPGDSIDRGDHIVTNDKASVLLTTADDYRIALAGSSRLDIAQDPKSKGAVYILREGRMHVWGSGKVSKARFLTPNSVTAPAAKEFEVSVGAGGAAEFLPIDGTLTVTAVANRLDWSKLPELGAN